MKLKLASAITAVAMAALTLPAFASASTGLTEGGSLIGSGAEFLGTNSGSIVTTSTKTGNVTCSSVKVFAQVRFNNSALVVADDFGTFGTSTATGCSAPSGAAVSVSEIRLNELKTTGEVVFGSTKKAIFNVSYKIKIGPLTCSYSTSTGEATYVAGASPAVLSINEQPLTVTPAACSTTARLDGNFTLSTVGGNALVLD